MIGGGTPDPPDVVGQGGVNDPPIVVTLTGVPEVGVVIEVVRRFSGDFAPIEPFLSYVTTDCTLELGAGGPPKCWQVPDTEQVEGTEVELFPTSVCEAEYQPRSAGTRPFALGVFTPPDRASGPIEVHSVYQLDTTTPGEPYLPVGEFAVVLSARRGDVSVGTRVRIADGQIVRIDYGCGATAPEGLALPDARRLFPATTTIEPSSGVGPGISVAEAVVSRLSGPLLVNGHLVIANGEVRLCQTLDQSYPPACGAPSLLVDGFDPDPATLTEDSGVTWSSDEVQILGERVGDRFVSGGATVGIATWPAGTETGIDVVDRVVAAAVTGDPAAFAQLVHYRAVPCAAPDAAGEGQLQCDDDEAAGTPIEVMQAAHCEGVLLRPSQVAPWLARAVAEQLGLHAAYVEEPAWTAERTGSAGRAYVVVLAPQSEPSTVTLIVDDGGLSTVIRSCGDPALEVLEGGLIPHGAEVLLDAPAEARRLAGP